tara:strand:+ start:281 stop:601 length:321 start_codon:yes stop_codon:yes gene_type:complete
MRKSRQGTAAAISIAQQTNIARVDCVQNETPLPIPQNRVEPTAIATPANTVIWLPVYVSSAYSTITASWVKSVKVMEPAVTTMDASATLIAMALFAKPAVGCVFNA